MKEEARSSDHDSEASRATTRRPKTRWALNEINAVTCCEGACLTQLRTLARNAALSKSTCAQKGCVHRRLVPPDFRALLARD